MGRQSRKFLTRVGAVALSVAIGTVMHRHLSLLKYWNRPLVNVKTFESQEDYSPCLKNSSSSNPFDLLVVGGGIIGLYTAVDGAQRGLKVALVEAEDFGCADSGQAPTVEAGAFPYVQRAFRQRDPIWLRRAWDVLEASAVWRNVAPDACAASRFLGVPPSEDLKLLSVNKPHTVVWTLLPAFHTAEMLELSVVGVVCTILSLLCGGATQYSVLSHSSRVSAELPGLGKKVLGGIWAQDVYLDRTRVVQQLLSTAEALGVSMLNYTPLSAIEYDTSSDNDPSAHKPPLIKAILSSSPRLLVTDASIKHKATRQAYNYTFSVYTKGLINCAGPWADHVQALTPCNASDAVPSAFDFFSLHSYLVAPRDALQTVSPSWPNPGHPVLAGDESGNTCHGQCAGARFLWYTALCEKWNGRYKDPTGLERNLPAFQANSTQYSFSTSMILPWYDHMILLGPSISRLEQLPSKLSYSSPVPFEAALRSTNNYQYELSHISNVLAATGIELDASKVLACVTSIVPVLKDRSVVPWAADLFYKGYHIATYHKRALQSSDTNIVLDKKSEIKREYLDRPPFVHVYGGTPILARRIAKEAVDALLTETCAISKETSKKLRKNGTKRLQLVGSDTVQPLHLTNEVQRGLQSTISLGMPPSKGADEETAKGIVTSLDGVAEPFRWAKRLALESYVQHLPDFVLRRIHLGYTSPAEAVRVLPHLANLLSTDLGWDTEQVKAEIDITKTLIEGFAVRATSQATTTNAT